MPIAFKEWAVTVRALAEGEQLVTLRKGGIREPDKHFALEHDFTPLFKLDHMLKDVRLCLEEARAAGAAFPAAALAGELYAAGAGRGLGEQDFAAVLTVVEALSDTAV